MRTIRTTPALRHRPRRRTAPFLTGMSGFGPGPMPGRDTPAPRQTTVETVDGGVRVYNFGLEGRIIELRFTDLPAGSAATPTALYGYLGMKYFLQSVVNWGELPFGYYDELAGAEVKVRYVGGIESFQQGVGGPRAGVIRLRKELV